MERNKIDDCLLVEIPKIYDPRGSLSVVEPFKQVPYDIKRVYYLYDVPAGAERGGHAHIKCRSLLIPLSGSFDVCLSDGSDTKTVHLNRPNVGLVIETGIWRVINNFSSGAVCLVLASEEYDEGDYIRDFDTFIKLKNQ